MPLRNGQGRGRGPQGQAVGRERKRDPRLPTSAHLSSPRPQPPPPTTYADISFIASCVSLFSGCLALWSPVLALPLFPLSALLRSLVARLLAHFLTYYGRGIQPSSENTTKPALFMTIQRGRRQYGAASQPASRPPRLRPRRPKPRLLSRLLSRPARGCSWPRPQGRALSVQMRVLKSQRGWGGLLCPRGCQSRQTTWKVIWKSVFLVSVTKAYIFL